MTSVAIALRSRVGRASGRAARLGWPVRIAIGWLVVVLVIAVAAPLLAPAAPNGGSLSDAFAGSSGQHLLGTDSLGRDLLSRIFYGARTSLLGPALVIAITTVIGTLIALLAAWRGGRIDAAIGAVTDLLMAFPGLLLALVAVALFGPGLSAPVIALVIAYVPYMARLIRSVAVRECSQPYVEALKVQGFPTWQIWLRHLVPNLAPSVLVQASVNFGYAMLDLAAISFIGLGVQPPQADWGGMVAAGQQSVLRGYPQQSLYAGAMIVLTVVAVNIAGEAIALRASKGRR